MPRKTPEQIVAAREAALRTAKIKLACAKNRTVAVAVTLQELLDDMPDLDGPESALLAALDSYIQSHL